MSAHWQDVYATREEAQTSWYCPHLALSLELIDGLRLAPSAPIIDVGGGRSTLVDDLLGQGYRNLTVLDLSEAALAQTRSRLGRISEGVRWIAGDVLDAELGAGRFALWHDRAVFHFFTDEARQDRYIDRVRAALQPGGHALVATFAADGPERCSGLPVCRYDGDSLAQRFGAGFERVATRRELHRTPFDSVQPFTYLLLRRSDDAAGANTRTTPTGAQA
jgi:SAM-dependent methyltransferase